MAAEEVAQEWAAAGRDGKKMVAEGVAAEGVAVLLVGGGGKGDGGRGGSGEGGGGGEVPREGRVDATCESIFSQIDLIA